MKKLDNTLQNETLHVKVFKEIEKAILDGSFQPGDSLTEMKLSTELGVSRTPVREALRQLELEGLVKSVPNKGVVVVGISEKDIDDIYTIRICIESLAAKWAAVNITDEELKSMRDVVELQEFYVNKGDALQVWQLDTRFHEIIYESSRSRPLRQTLSQFHNYIQKPREISMKSAGRSKTAVEEHRKLYEALQAHDADKAEIYTAEHIRNAKLNLLKILKNHL
ncbi:MAG: transcriptional regulator, GntR family [Clostridia bacterium]|nr:transcriptional regulator, GntR family [Clostridia bacterium]